MSKDSCLTIWSVSIPRNPSFLDILAIMYGYMTPLFVVYLIVMIALKRGTREIWWLLFWLPSAIATRVVKSLIKQERPDQSCMFGKSFGMPSGHASLAMGWLVLITLDVSQKQIMFGPDRVWAKVSLYVALGALLPVPISRVIIHDHSMLQIMAGSVLGALLALSWRSLSFTIRLKFRNYEWTDLMTVLYHNYPHPQSPQSDQYIPMKSSSDYKMVDDDEEEDGEEQEYNKKADDNNQVTMFEV